MNFHYYYDENLPSPWANGLKQRSEASNPRTLAPQVAGSIRPTSYTPKRRAAVLRANLTQFCCICI